MALHPTGLGKGLGALIRETQGARESEGVQTLPLEDILPNPRQPRRNFSDKALEELAASIRSQGLLQPLLVRPAGPATPGKYEIVAGERRWRASRLAGLKEVPVLIRSLSAQDTLAAALIENLQREDLNPLEEALGLQTLKEEFGLSQDELAQKIGRSRSAIANSLRLLTLPESMRTLLADGSLSSGHARALLSITVGKAQEALKNLILERHLSVREAEGLAAGWKANGRFLLAGIDTDGQADAEAAAPLGEDETAAGEPDAVAPAPEGEKRARPQSARILEIQNRIGQVLQLPVRVTGKESKGKISFSYNSKEELEAFLEKLAGFVLEGANHTALPGRQQDALGSAGHDMLERLTRDALNTSAHPGLAASGHTALSGEAHGLLTGAERQALRGSSAAALEQRENGLLEHRRQPVLDGSKNGALAAAPDRQALAAASDSAFAAPEAEDFSKSPLRRVTRKLSGAADGMRTDEAAASVLPPSADMPTADMPTANGDAHFSEVARDDGAHPGKAAADDDDRINDAAMAANAPDAVDGGSVDTAAAASGNPADDRRVDSDNSAEHGRTDVGKPAADAAATGTRPAEDAPATAATYTKDGAATTATYAEKAAADSGRQPDDPATPATGLPSDGATPATGLPDDGATPPTGLPSDGATPPTGHSGDGAAAVGKRSTAAAMPDGKRPDGTVADAALNLSGAAAAASAQASRMRLAAALKKSARDSGE